MGYDRIMSFGILLNAIKQQGMDDYKNIKLEDIIKRDDFISVANEASEYTSGMTGMPVNNFYKVKMRSKRVLKRHSASGIQNGEYLVWKYFDLFDREVQHPEYFFFIAKPYQPRYHYVVDKNFVINVRDSFDSSPLTNGEQLFHTRQQADVYVYENKKVATQKQLDEKTKAAYENGKEVEFMNQRYQKKTPSQCRIDEERAYNIHLKGFDPFK